MSRFPSFGGFGVLDTTDTGLAQLQPEIDNDPRLEGEALTDLARRTGQGVVELDGELFLEPIRNASRRQEELEIAGSTRPYTSRERDQILDLVNRQGVDPGLAGIMPSLSREDQMQAGVLSGQGVDPQLVSALFTAGRDNQVKSENASIRQQQAVQARQLLEAQQRTDSAVIRSRTEEYNRALRALDMRGGGTAEQRQELENQYRISIGSGLNEPNPLLLAQAEDDEDNPRKKLARTASFVAKRWGPALQASGATEEDVASFLWLDPETNNVQGVKELKEFLGIAEPTPEGIRAEEVRAMKAIDEMAKTAEMAGETLDPREVMAAKSRARDAIRGTSSYVPPRVVEQPGNFFSDPYQVTQHADFGTAVESFVGSLGGQSAAPARATAAPVARATQSTVNLQASQQEAAKTGLPIVADNDDLERLKAQARATGSRQVTFIFDGAPMTLDVN